MVRVNTIYSMQILAGHNLPEERRPEARLSTSSGIKFYHLVMWSKILTQSRKSAHLVFPPLLTIFGYGESNAKSCQADFFL